MKTSCCSLPVVDVSANCDEWAVDISAPAVVSAYIVDRTVLSSDLVVVSGGSDCEVVMASDTDVISDVTDCEAVAAAVEISTSVVENSEVIVPK